MPTRLLLAADVADGNMTSTGIITNTVLSAGTNAGRITHLTVCQREAPSEADASSDSGSKSSRTGCTVLTTNGKPTKIKTSTMPRRV